MNSFLKITISSTNGGWWGSSLLAPLLEFVILVEKSLLTTEIWIAGPLAMLLFASVTFVSAFSLCHCYRSPGPGPKRNPSYLEAVRTILVSHKLQQLGWIPELILSSDAVRTKETLKTMQEQVRGFLEAEQWMDTHTTEHLQHAICKFSRDKILTVMCMRHNRGWEEVASMFSGTSIELKTCNAALLEATGKSWEDWVGKSHCCIPKHTVITRDGLLMRMKTAQWKKAAAKIMMKKKKDFMDIGDRATPVYAFHSKERAGKPEYWIMKKMKIEEKKKDKNELVRWQSSMWIDEAELVKKRHKLTATAASSTFGSKRH
ncbi:hypothetical protein HYC85_014229 [Camellia sinensis]|uniref:Uncharacterized protein n=1 Tax=Camellia sinensis TaxID=4442 RepID=A0A7J7H5L9_CAMSI|nr:hypothetical protein HYC85_014229 [Camellia sinensis]